MRYGEFAPIYRSNRFGEVWPTYGDSSSYGAGMTGVETALADSANTVAPGIVAQAQAISLPGESLIDSIARAASTLMMTDAQRRLLNIQIDRASKGLPPLDASQYGMGVNVGIAPATQKLIIFGGIAILAALLLPKLLRR